MTTPVSADRTSQGGGGRGRTRLTVATVAVPRRRPAFPELGPASEMVCRTSCVGAPSSAAAMVGRPRTAAMRRKERTQQGLRPRCREPVHFLDEELQERGLPGAPPSIDRSANNRQRSYAVEQASWSASAFLRSVARARRAPGQRASSGVQGTSWRNDGYPRQDIHLRQKRGQNLITVQRRAELRVDHGGRRRQGGRRRTSLCEALSSVGS